MVPEQVPLPKGLIESFEALQDAIDASQFPVRLFYRPGDRSAVLIYAVCGGSCPPMLRVSYLDESGQWSAREPRGDEEADLVALTAAIKKGRLEIREVQRRQLFVDGKPVSEPFK